MVSNPANAAHDGRPSDSRHAVVNAIRVPVLIASRSGVVIDFNDAVVDLVGDAAHLLGRPIHEALPLVPPVDPTAEGEDRWTGRIADAAGRSVDLEVSRAPLTAGGLTDAFVYVVHDVSRHAELNRLREQLLYNVAHELRGPLAVLDNSLEILAAEYASLSAADFLHLLNSARRTAARLHTLMDDLLSAGAIQSGRFTVRQRTVPLAAIVNDTLDGVDLTLRERAQRVDVSITPPHIRVLADARALGQVLTNLINNASKYGPEREPIELQAERAGRFVRVSITDHGPGIPPDQRPGLFERFYRVRPGNEAPGIGLGLAIAKGIIEAHGGTIGVESERARGTRVWFTLPPAGGAP